MRSIKYTLRHFNPLGYNLLVVIFDTEADRLEIKGFKQNLPINIRSLYS